MTSNIATNAEKITEWFTCKNGPWHPSLSHGGYVAYRIWFHGDGRSWFQRHEWKRADGSFELNAWIPSFAKVA